MRWYSDPTGKFSRRPHYTFEEMDSMCEQVVTGFLVERYGKAVFPISSEDLTVMIERDVEYLDLYTDFSDGEEGETKFVLGELPKVKIARYLSEDPRYENRRRTTLTHEYFHVKVQGFLYSPRYLIPDSPTQAAPCKSISMLRADRTDWLEWQAGYGSIAMLMPISATRALIASYLSSNKNSKAPFRIDSASAEALISKAMTVFGVSHEAAEIRLLGQRVLTNERSKKIREMENAILVKPECIHLGCGAGRCKKAVRIGGIDV